MRDDTAAITVKVIERIDAVSADDWDACVGSDHPFVRHGFLHALEESGSVSAAKGWLPQHLVIEDEDGRINAVCPLYLKSHSYGEYVFDWGWAEAYERAGGAYYPKLQSAVPFTPVTGPRLMVRDGVSEAHKDGLISGMLALAERFGVSSLHVTFPDATDFERLLAHGFLPRIGQQYHWTNHSYTDFDHFLGQLSSRKRKAIRKERRAVTEADITHRVLRGNDISEADWGLFYRFYRDTSDRKWGSAYLTRGFFSMLQQAMGDQVVLFFAERDGRTLAGALNLIGNDTLYGRYWGSIETHNFLHFETCYYQAIEFAITHGLASVEAGAQGPHKIQRGYMPIPTYSAHWIKDDTFRTAVERFLAEEREAVVEDIQDLALGSPYKNGTA